MGHILLLEDADEEGQQKSLGQFGELLLPSF